jgi:hypothetical protein
MPAIQSTAVTPPVKTPKVDANGKIRRPAKELMAERKRMTFGQAYIQGVLAGTHHDVAKMVVHANHLGLGSPSALASLKVETLRERLAEAILTKEDGAKPFTIKLQA